MIWAQFLKQNIFKRPSASRIPPKNPRLPRFLLLGTQARTLHRNVAKFIFHFKNSPHFSHPLASASTYPFWGRVGMNSGNLVAKCWNWVLKIEPLSFRSTLSKKDSKEATKKRTHSRANSRHASAPFRCIIHGSITNVSIFNDRYRW